MSMTTTFMTTSSNHSVATSSRNIISNSSSTGPPDLSLLSAFPIPPVHIPSSLNSTPISPNFASRVPSASSGSFPPNSGSSSTSSTANPPPTRAPTDPLPPLPSTPSAISEKDALAFISNHRSSILSTRSHTPSRLGHTKKLSTSSFSHAPHSALPYVGEFGQQISGGASSAQAVRSLKISTDVNVVGNSSSSRSATSPTSSSPRSPTFPISAAESLRSRTAIVLSNASGSLVVGNDGLPRTNRSNIDKVPHHGAAAYVVRPEAVVALPPSSNQAAEILPHSISTSHFTLRQQDEIKLSAKSASLNGRSAVTTGRHGLGQGHTRASSSREILPPSLSRSLSASSSVSEKENGSAIATAPVKSNAMDTSNSIPHAPSAFPASVASLTTPSMSRTLSQSRAKPLPPAPIATPMSSSSPEVAANNKNGLSYPSASTAASASTSVTTYSSTHPTQVLRSYPSNSSLGAVRQIRRPGTRTAPSSQRNSRATNSSSMYYDDDEDGDAADAIRATSPDIATILSSTPRPSKRLSTRSFGSAKSGGGSVDGSVKRKRSQAAVAAAVLRRQRSGNANVNASEASRVSRTSSAFSGGTMSSSGGGTRISSGTLLDDIDDVLDGEGIVDRAEELENAEAYIACDALVEEGEGKGGGKDNENAGDISGDYGVAVARRPGGYDLGYGRPHRDDLDLGIGMDMTMEEMGYHMNMGLGMEIEDHEFYAGEVGAMFQFDSGEKDGRGRKGARVVPTTASTGVGVGGVGNAGNGVGVVKGEGSDTDSDIDLHTPLPHIMLREGVLSPHSKLLGQVSLSADSPAFGLGRPMSVASNLTTASVTSVMTKSGIFKDDRDTERRRTRHRDGKLLKGGLGLTTGLGWSDSEDEDAPSPLTHRLSNITLSRSPSMASFHSSTSRSQPATPHKRPLQSSRSYSATMSSASSLKKQKPPHPLSKSLSATALATIPDSGRSAAPRNKSGETMRSVTRSSATSSPSPPFSSSPPLPPVSSTSASSSPKTSKTGVRTKHSRTPSRINTSAAANKVLNYSLPLSPDLDSNRVSLASSSTTNGSYENDDVVSSSGVSGAGSRRTSPTASVPLPPPSSFAYSGTGSRKAKVLSSSSSASVGSTFSLTVSIPDSAHGARQGPGSPTGNGKGFGSSLSAVVERESDTPLLDSSSSPASGASSSCSLPFPPTPLDTPYDVRQSKIGMTDGGSIGSGSGEERNGDGGSGTKKRDGSGSLQSSTSTSASISASMVKRNGSGSGGSAGKGTASSSVGNVSDSGKGLPLNGGTGIETKSTGQHGLGFRSKTPTAAISSGLAKLTLRPRSYSSSKSEPSSSSSVTAKDDERPPLPSSPLPGSASSSMSASISGNPTSFMTKSNPSTPRPLRLPALHQKASTTSTGDFSSMSLSSLKPLQPGQPTPKPGGSLLGYNRNLHDKQRTLALSAAAGASLPSSPIGSNGPSVAKIGASTVSGLRPRAYGSLPSALHPPSSYNARRSPSPSAGYGDRRLASSVGSKIGSGNGANANSNVSNAGDVTPKKPQPRTGTGMAYRQSSLPSSIGAGANRARAATSVVGGRPIAL